MNEFFSLHHLIPYVLIAAPNDAGSPSSALNATDIVTQIQLWHQQLLTWPPLNTVALMIAGLLPLFFGWVFIRFSTATSLACAAGLAIWIALNGHVSAVLVWCSIAFVGLLAAVMGWFLYQAMIAFKGALLAGLLCALVAEQLTASLESPWVHIISLIAGFIGAALGAFLGWRLAPWVAIIETSVIGALMIGAGYCGYSQARTNAEFLIGGAIAVIALVAGLYVQSRREKRAQD